MTVQKSPKDIKKTSRSKKNLRVHFISIREEKKKFLLKMIVVVAVMTEKRVKREKVREKLDVHAKNNS